MPILECGSRVAKQLILKLYGEFYCLKMYHCSHFNKTKTMYLFDNKDFRHRIVSVGTCPKCKKLVCALSEQRKTDGLIFHTQYSGSKANSFLKKIQTSINYSNEKKRVKNPPIGWRFGINKLKNGILKQYSCDFRGNKELVKTKHAD